MEGYKPIIIDCDDDRLYFRALKGCKPVAQADLAQSVVTFRRIGGGCSVETKIHEQLCDGRFAIMLSKEITELPKGRYWVEIWLPDNCHGCCDRFQVQIGQACFLQGEGTNNAECC